MNYEEALEPAREPDATHENCKAALRNAMQFHRVNKNNETILGIARAPDVAFQKYRAAIGTAMKFARIDMYMIYIRFDTNIKNNEAVLVTEDLTFGVDSQLSISEGLKSEAFLSTGFPAAITYCQ